MANDDKPREDKHEHDDPQPDHGHDDEHGHSDGGSDLGTDLLKVVVPCAEYSAFDPDAIKAWVGRAIPVAFDLGALGAPNVHTVMKVASVQLPEGRRSAVLWLAK